MIALIDYGIGNLRSVEKAFESLGAEVLITSDVHTILGAERVVLPGVGAFGDGMQGLQAIGLVEPLKDLVARRTPVLGICLGMQLLFEESEEHGRTSGLGLLPGKVRRFESSALKVPQTGWNLLIKERQSDLLQGLANDAYAYFNHSYYCDAASEDMLASADYGVRFAAVVGRDNLYGVQFHPEKSQQVGLKILQNFLELD
jgi:glutamine amidotransferase